MGKIALKWENWELLYIKLTGDNLLKLKQKFSMLNCWDDRGYQKTPRIEALYPQSRGAKRLILYKLKMLLFKFK